MPPRWNGQPAPRIKHRSISIGAATTSSASMRPISSARAFSTRSRACSAVLGRLPTLNSFAVSSLTYGSPSGVQS